MKEMSFRLHLTVLIKSIRKSLMSETSKEATAGSEVKQRSWAKRTEEPDWSGDTWDIKIKGWINAISSVLSLCGEIFKDITLTCIIFPFSTWLMLANWLSCRWIWKWPEPWIKDRFSYKDEHIESLKYNKNVQMRNVREGWTCSLWLLDGWIKWQSVWPTVRHLPIADSHTETLELSTSCTEHIFYTLLRHT